MKGWVLALLIAAPAGAAFEERPFSARAAAVGESLVALPGSVDGIYYNPALLAASSGARVSAGHTRLWGLEDLPQSTLAGALPSAYGHWGAAVTEFGSALYREQEVALSWAVGVSSAAQAGVTVKNRRIEVERYGQDSALDLDLGVSGRPWPRVSVGASVKNLGGSRLFGETPPTVLAAGASSEIAPGFFVAGAISTDGAGRSICRVGQETRLARPFLLRAGFQTGPNRFSIGFGLTWARWVLDYAFLTQGAEFEQSQVNVGWGW